MADLLLLRMLCWQFAKSTDSQVSQSDGLFCIISIWKFGSFKNLSVTITSLSEIYFWFRRFILLVQTKKWFLWTMAAAQAAEIHGDALSLTRYLWWGLYKSIPTWNHSQNSLVVIEAVNLKISSHVRTLKWSQRTFQTAWE